MHHILKGLIIAGLSLCFILFGATLGRADSPIDSTSCAFNGIPLNGLVEIVESFPDITVQVVSSFPDLRVQVVSSFPDQCGQWQYTDSFPDFKVQFVESFPDIRVQFVESFPGVP